MVLFNSAYKNMDIVMFDVQHGVVATISDEQAHRVTLELALVHPHIFERFKNKKIREELLKEISS